MKKYQADFSTQNLSKRICGQCNCNRSQEDRLFNQMNLIKQNILRSTNRCKAFRSEILNRVYNIHNHRVIDDEGSQWFLQAVQNIVYILKF